MVDFENIQKKMVSGMSEMPIVYFQAFKEFFIDLIQFKDIKERAENLKDIQFKYEKETERIFVSFKFEDVTGLQRIDLSILDGFEDQCCVTNNVARKDEYIVNMIFRKNEFS